MIVLNGNRVTNSVTQERWEKMRNKIWWLAKQIRIVDCFTTDMFKDVLLKAECVPRDNIHYKTMESLIRFIVYVSLMYTRLTLYLKGIYLTLNSWRSGQDDEGWLTAEAK